ncbi:3-phosphoshikimate 1-carboxyvinyltransferase [Verrucomicrobia bacterium]|nr:3-phosphoshikimate 1-carboxyvinyltransferase [Verrucomicrobiota bacterium]
MHSKNNIIRVKKAKNFGGEVSVPGDKSISHRAVMLASISNGRCKINGFLPSEDCLSTLEAMRTLGVQIDILEENEFGPNGLMIHGKGLNLTEPKSDIECGNSGTTMRLLSGILAGQKFSSRLIGDESLSTRPMERIVSPLRSMGCEIRAQGENGCAPILINGGGLKGISYELPVASAQVKSALLLAGLYAEGRTSVVEPLRTRDHTEKMLDFFQVGTNVHKNEISIDSGQVLESRDFVVPGDVSSAAFWLVAASAFPDSQLTVKNVGLNPTRNGILKILVRMGAYVSELYRINRPTQLTPELTVLMYGFARYMQSTPERISKFSKVMERGDTGRSIPVPAELAKLFGFETQKEFEDDWINYLKSTAFK